MVVFDYRQTSEKRTQQSIQIYANLPVCSSHLYQVWISIELIALIWSLDPLDRRWRPGGPVQWLQWQRLRPRQIWGNGSRDFALDFGGTHMEFTWVNQRIHGVNELHMEYPATAAIQQLYSSYTAPMKFVWVRFWLVIFII